jgi:DNA helicase HerA-like ATPase
MTNRIIFITGRKGSGKTTLSNEIAQTAMLGGRRVIVIAPMGGIELPGCPVISSLPELLEDKTRGRSFVVQPDSDELAAKVLQYGYLVGNCVLVVDEIDLYANNTSPMWETMNIIRYGRHRACSLVGISQRPANVVRDLTAQADYLIMFQSTENRDIEYLAGRIGPELGEQVRNLAQFEYRIYSAYSGGLVNVPKIGAILWAETS